MQGLMSAPKKFERQDMDNILTMNQVSIDRPVYATGFTAVYY